jgi:TRAP-type C4-dicarboxylate transport system permease small subunit
MRSDPSALPPEMRGHTLYRVKSTVDLVLGWALVALMGLAVVNVLWQVFTRFVLANPSSFTDELARYLLIWVGLFGAAYASGKRAHLAIDLLRTKLRGRSVHWHGIFVGVVVSTFALFVMVIGGVRLVSLSFLLGQTSAALGVPLGVVYLALPVSGALIVFYFALFITERVRLLNGKPPALPVLQETTAEAFAENADPAQVSADEADLTRGGPAHAPDGPGRRPGAPPPDLAPAR